MTTLSTFIRFELKRVMANLCRKYAAEGKPLPDKLAVRLMIIDQLKTLELVEVQPEDERKAG